MPCNTTEYNTHLHVFGIPSELKIYCYDLRYYKAFDICINKSISKWSYYKINSYHLFALRHSLVSNIHYLDSIDQIINGVMW